MAGFWLASLSGLIPLFLSGEMLGSQTGQGLTTIGLMTALVFLTLRSTWRGGAGTIVVTGAALLFAVAYELAGLVTTVQWLLGSGPIPLWTSVLLIVLAACPFYAYTLLLSPAAWAYAHAWHQ